VACYYSCSTSLLHCVARWALVEIFNFILDCIRVCEDCICRLQNIAVSLARWALEKREKRLRCHLGHGRAWAQGATFLMGFRTLMRMEYPQFWLRNGPAWGNVEQDECIANCKPAEHTQRKSAFSMARGDKTQWWVFFARLLLGNLLFHLVEFFATLYYNNRPTVFFF